MSMVDFKLRQELETRTEMRRGQLSEVWAWLRAELHPHIPMLKPQNVAVWRWVATWVAKVHEVMWAALT